MSREYALVTGATSGIGAAIACVLAGRGATVGVLGRRRHKADELLVKLREAGGEGISLAADIGDSRQVKAAVDEFVAITGRLDTVVANAGIALPGNVIDMDEDDWSRTIRCNLDGTFYTARFTLPHLLVSKGTFTAISSEAGLRGAAGYAAYSAAKWGIIGFVRTLALDYGPYGVRSNVVCPGCTQTPMAEAIFRDVSPSQMDTFRQSIPLRRFAKPEEIAEAVGHLSSPAASYSNGAVYVVDGGMTA